MFHIVRGDVSQAKDVAFRRARDGVRQGEWGLMEALLMVLHYLTVKRIEFNGCSHI